MFNEMKHSILIFTILTFMIVTISCLFTFTPVQAQYWAALPPYNVMWPLWSTILSPPNPATGLPTPLVPVLNRNTILPVQPALAWDPLQPGGSGMPWLLYNTPLALGGGLLYWDVYYGMNTWPPSYMLDPATGAPAPITLPLGWSVYLPTKLDAYYWFLPIANSVYSFQYGVPIADLLTTADILGLPPLSSLTPPII